MGAYDEDEYWDAQERAFNRGQKHVARQIEPLIESVVSGDLDFEAFVERLEQIVGDCY